MKVVVERFNDMGTLRFQLAGPVGIITISRPHQRNALTKDMWHTISEWTNKLPKKTRVLVIRGAGQDFTAGSDIKEFAKLSPQEANEAFETMETAMKSIESIPIPTMASINGPAFGAGFILAMACDIRIGTEKAKFGMPVGKLGITLEEPFLSRMIRTLGTSRTMDLVYTARSYDADRALEVGILNYVTNSENLGSETLKLCRKILMQSRASLRAVKENVLNPVPKPTAKQRSWVDAADFMEGVQAFSEKRAARF
ncbi:enoyl-CoA hydratase/isomerase family protein [Alicyclobacillus sp. SO9]|uniref:enoyl-CoA hydratase/isomerase family protein n=1 Tax=Alicyclobacillus sp. SO9 TaxID=2665646 RepID=UPI0018E7524B|nr:enoyl-CoA hydratase/isomerase family protein [Alicyclobacillus sp. SO9]QQE77583.1 enoyl-CoA hydratase/isomerase family protein [Alicyclobacillus sp. SO9]